MVLARPLKLSPLWRFPELILKSSKCASPVTAHLFQPSGPYSLCLFPALYLYLNSIHDQQ